MPVIWWMKCIKSGTYHSKTDEQTSSDILQRTPACCLTTDLLRLWDTENCVWSEVKGSVQLTGSVLLFCLLLRNGHGTSIDSAGQTQDLEVPLQMYLSIANLYRCTIEMKGLKRDAKWSFLPGGDSIGRKSKALNSRMSPMCLPAFLSNQWEQKYVYRSTVPSLMFQSELLWQWFEEGIFSAIV